MLRWLLIISNYFNIFPTKTRCLGISVYAKSINVTQTYLRKSGFTYFASEGTNLFINGPSPGRSTIFWGCNEKVKEWESILRSSQHEKDPTPYGRVSKDTDEERTEEWRTGFVDS